MLKQKKARKKRIEEEISELKVQHKSGRNNMNKTLREKDAEIDKINDKLTQKSDELITTKKNIVKVSKG